MKTNSQWCAIQLLVVMINPFMSQADLLIIDVNLIPPIKCMITRIDPYPDDNLIDSNKKTNSLQLKKHFQLINWFFGFFKNWCIICWWVSIASKYLIHNHAPCRHLQIPSKWWLQSLPLIVPESKDDPNKLISLNWWTATGITYN